MGLASSFWRADYVPLQCKEKKLKIVIRGGPMTLLLSAAEVHSLLWDDEDTCDAFSFQKNRHANSSKLANVASPGGGGRVNERALSISGGKLLLN